MNTTNININSNIFNEEPTIYDQDFEDQAMMAMQDIGLPEDEAEAMLDDYLYMFGL